MKLQNIKKKQNLKDNNYIRGIQIKTTMRYHLTKLRMTIIKNLETINAREGVEKREHFYTVVGNVNWYSHYREQYGDSLNI